MNARLQDLRLALRTLGRTPGLTAIGILTLGTGIAMITVVFSLIDAFFLRPLPFPEPERLVHVWQTDGKIGYDTLRMSVPNFEDLRQRSTAFEDLGGYFYTTYILGGDGGRPATVNATHLTPSLLSVLGVEPVLGRGFTAAEGQAGEGQVVLISHRFWRRHFASSGDVLGRSLTLDHRPYTVVGVMPASFVFPFNDMDLWVPLDVTPYREDRASNGPLLVVGRLADGQTPATAQRELDTLMRGLELAYPDSNEEKGAQLVDLRSELLFTYDVFAVIFPALLLAVAFLLLIVCANLGNLMLARGAEREGEMALRRILGAGRRRLLAQLLTESTLLALLGGAAGALLAWWGTRGLEHALPGELYRAAPVGLDGRALAIALLVALGCALVFGLAPALHATRLDLAAATREGGRGASGGVRRRRLRRTLVVVQVALAVLLVTGASLMAQTLVALRSVDLGFETHRMLTAEVTLPRSQYPDDAAENAYFDQLLERVRGLPGVESAATIYPLPLNHESLGEALEVEGREPAGDTAPYSHLMWVTPGWFATARIPLLSGRRFDRRDGPESEPVAIVNRHLSETLWPERGALGQRIRHHDRWRRVVGVVADSVVYDLDEKTPLMVYLPQGQESTARRFLMVRSAGDPLALWPSVEAAITPIDPGQPLENVRSMRQVITTWLAARMMGIGGLGALGLGALLLAALGLYGVLRHTVVQRTHELGIRSALGARGGDLVRWVVGEGMGMVLAGIGLGLAGAALLTRYLQSLLFGVQPLDPTTFAVTPLVLLAVAVLACWGPARRAVRIDPADALRRE